MRLLLLLLLLICSLCHLAAAECQLVTSCSCRNDDGSVVDLSPLANTAGQPAFSAVDSDQQTITYLYNPCNGFSCGGAAGSAVCQKQKAVPTENYIDYGVQSSAQFATEAGQLQLRYTSSDGTTSSSVSLVCDSNAATPTFTKTGDVPGSSVRLQLTSAQACAVGGGGLSAGDILLIVFFSLLVLYLVVGVLVNKFALHQTGLQLVPNLSLWAQLPGLVRDGARFCFEEVQSRLPTAKRQQFQEI